MAARYTAPIRPRRSLLFMPGSNQRALDKARTLNADVLIFDLEDSVAPEAKETARAHVAEAITVNGYDNRERVVRINGLLSDWWEDDLRIIAKSKADAILLPKVEKVEDITQVLSFLQEIGASETLPIWCMIETPLGVINCQSIAACSYRVKALIAGTNDLLFSLGAQSTPDRANVIPYLSRILLSGRAHGQWVFDGVFNDYRDLKGFTAECEQGVMMGFDGKTLIHPATLDIANQIFTPRPVEVDTARRLITAFEKAMSEGKGAIGFEGKMIEKLHYDHAIGIVTLADEIERRNLLMAA